MIVCDSQLYKGVRDWTVKARRKDDDVVVTVKAGRMLHSRVNLSVSTWPGNLYDQRQAATKALGEAINMPVSEWDNSELDRIPDEIVHAMNELYQRA